MSYEFTRYLGQKSRGDHRPRTRPNSSQAYSTSPRRVILSILLLAVLRYSFALTLDIGPGPFLNLPFVRMRIVLGLASSNIVWTQGSIGPHNSPSKSCFSAPRKKMRILILSSDLLYRGQIATTRVRPLMIHPWLFSAQVMPSFNFGNPFVSHVQRLDDNPTAVELSGNLSGRIPALNFCTTISSLSNRFLVTFERLRYSRTQYFLSLFHSFVRLQIPKSCPRTISHTCKFS